MKRPEKELWICCREDLCLRSLNLLHLYQLEEGLFLFWTKLCLKLNLPVARKLKWKSTIFGPMFCIASHGSVFRFWGGLFEKKSRNHTFPYPMKPASLLSYKLNTSPALTTSASQTAAGSLLRDDSGEFRLCFFLFRFSGQPTYNELKTLVFVEN